MATVSALFSRTKKPAAQAGWEMHASTASSAPNQARRRKHGVIEAEKVKKCRD
jgi:hypothetical protein